MSEETHSILSEVTHGILSEVTHNILSQVTHSILFLAAKYASKATHRLSLAAKHLSDQD